MHIGWSFLDKRKATINAIEAYRSMSFIIKNSELDIEKIRARMEGVGSPNIDGMPHSHDPQAAEERMITCIEEIDTIKERYRQAKEYMSWFQPAWDQLSDDERFVLEVFHMDGTENGIFTVENHFNIEKTSAYNKKNRALDHLTTLLYGKA